MKLNEILNIQYFGFLTKMVDHNPEVIMQFVADLRSLFIFIFSL